MSALFHPHLCGRIAAEWLIKMKEKIMNEVERCLVENGIDPNHVVIDEIDSIKFISTLVGLENEFDVVFPDELLRVDLFSSVDNLVDIILKLKGES